MTHLKYILKGFGFENSADYKHSVYGLIFSGDNADLKLMLIALAGSVRFFIKASVGFDLPVFCAFVFLVIAEFYSGVKVSRKVNKQKFKSRPVGRMIVKIGTYLLILSVLQIFASGINAPDIMGVNMNPFTWLYYVVFIGIVFQLLISWFENLGCLGYKETRTLAGFILRKFNKWFEFDGSKFNNDHDKD